MSYLAKYYRGLNKISFVMQSFKERILNSPVRNCDAIVFSCCEHNGMFYLKCVSDGSKESRLKMFWVSYSILFHSNYTCIEFFPSLSRNCN